MSPERVQANDAAISRLAARREVRRLRKNKKKVPAELLARAGFGAMVTEEVARKRKVAVTVASKSGPVVVKVNRQQAAKELGIKNRRWMNVAELDEAINLANEKRDDGKKPRRLLELEEIGRRRCRAAWDAWKAKQPASKK